MARIVVHSMAHRGDVYPYVPIATELCRRGHEVTYVVPREFHSSFAAEPFRCVHSGTDFSPVELAWCAARSDRRTSQVSADPTPELPGTTTQRS